MRNVLYCAVLFLAGMVLAQQPEQPPSMTSPPYQTPPTFPEGGQTPREQMPPDTQAPPPHRTSNEHVEGQIVKELRAEPNLSRTNIDARVTDNSVVLIGNVDTMAQHDLAVRIAQANAGDRKIVDNINVKKRT
jgi:BON domain-containing protein